MQRLAKAALMMVLGRRWSTITLGPRLATLGERPVDRVRLLALGVLLPVLSRSGALGMRRAHVRVRLEGAAVPLVLGDASDYHVLAGSRAGDAVPDFVASPRTIVDCGAHIGTVALQYRARFPDARIYAVEPDSTTGERLRRNLKGVPNVVIVPIAVSGHSGSAPFYRSDQSWGSSLIEDRTDAIVQRTTVRMMTLSDLFDHYGLAEVDLLKLDVEGAELDVLRNVSGLARVNAIVGELHYDLGKFTEQDLLALLSDFHTEVVPYSADRALLRARRRVP